MSRYGRAKHNLSEPAILKVLAVFPTQRFLQPHPAAPPPTPTIATYKLERAADAHGALELNFPHSLRSRLITG